MKIGDIAACRNCAGELRLKMFTYYNGNQQLKYIHADGGRCRVKNTEMGEPFEPLDQQVVSELLDLDEMDARSATR